MSRKYFNKQKILERDNYICQYCGDYGNVVDHILPVNYKDIAKKDNLITSCRTCNSILSDKVFDTFLDKWEYVINKRYNKMQKRIQKIQKMKSKIKLEMKLQRKYIDNKKYYNIILDISNLLKSLRNS